SWAPTSPIDPDMARSPTLASWRPKPRLGGVLMALGSLPGGTRGFAPRRTSGRGARQPAHRLRRIVRLPRQRRSHGRSERVAQGIGTCALGDAPRNSASPCLAGAAPPPLGEANLQLSLPAHATPSAARPPKKARTAYPTRRR